MWRKDDWRMPLVKRYAKEFAYRFKDGDLGPSSLGIVRRVLRMSPLEWPRLASHETLPRSNASLDMLLRCTTQREKMEAELMATIAQWLLKQPEVNV